MRKPSLLSIAALSASLLCAPLPALAWHGGGNYHGGYHGNFHLGGGCYGCGWGIFGGALLGGALVAPYYNPYYTTPAPSYWYYCDSAGMYYPYIQVCASGFRPVAPY